MEKALSNAPRLLLNTRIDLSYPANRQGSYSILQRNICRAVVYQQLISERNEKVALTFSAMPWHTSRIDTPLSISGRRSSKIFIRSSSRTFVADDAISGVDPDNPEVNARRLLGPGSGGSPVIVGDLIELPASDCAVRGANLPRFPL
jgi:hypothetical protein